MKNTNRKYTNEQIDVLSGKIRGTIYLDELKAQLEKLGKTYSDGYIYRVITGVDYNNDIWDAAKGVIKDRKQKREESRMEVEQLVSEV